MADREQPRDAIDRRSEIIAVALVRMPGVDRHSHLEAVDAGPILGGEPLLCVERRGDRVGDVVKRRAKRVAHRLEDVSVVGFYRRLKDLTVTADGGFHLLAMALPSFRRAFDVGEQKRDGAGWEVLAGCYRLRHSHLSEWAPIACDKGDGLILQSAPMRAVLRPAVAPS